jgi:hypothetical protein
MYLLNIQTLLAILQWVSDIADVNNDGLLDIFTTNLNHL